MRTVELNGNLKHNLVGGGSLFEITIISFGYVVHYNLTDRYRPVYSK